MHDRVRKACCRLLFIVAIAAPTLGMLAWGVARKTVLVRNQAKMRWEKQLTVKLGLKVTLAAVENPRPGLVVLRDAQLQDAETGVACGKIAAIRLSKSAGQQLVQLEDLQLQLVEHPETWQWFVQHVLRQTDLGNVVVSTSRIHVGASPTELGLACHLRSELPQTTLTVNLANSYRNDAPVAIQVHRQHQAMGVTEVTLDTARTALPCQLLLPLLPNLASLGGETSFQGQLSAKETDGNQVMEIVGEFAGVDLQRWLRPLGSSGLTGVARLQLQKARIINDHCVQASGSLVAENGRVKRSFLQRAAGELGLQWIHDLDAEEEHYAKLSCRFDLDQNGIQLSGEDQGRNPGVVLRHRNGVLLAAAITPRRLSGQTLVRSFNGFSTRGGFSTQGLPLSRAGLRLLQEPGQPPLYQASPADLPGTNLPR